MPCPSCLEPHLLHWEMKSVIILMELGWVLREEDAKMEAEVQDKGERNGQWSRSSWKGRRKEGGLARKCLSLRCSLEVQRSPALDGNSWTLGSRFPMLSHWLQVVWGESGRPQQEHDATGVLKSVAAGRRQLIYLLAASLTWTLELLTCRTAQYPCECWGFRC